MWIDLSATLAQNPQTVGLKAAGVARLAQAGLPVPRGWCLPVEVDAAPPGMEELTSAVASGEDHIWRRRLALLRAVLTSARPSDEVRREVERLCASEAGPLAVRSSAIAEGCSLSGVLSTFLGVRGPEALLGAIQGCWLSRWSDAAIRYAWARGIGLNQLRMGVLVQRMVVARAAGGARSQAGEVLIEATWGLGRGLAEGEVVPDVWRIVDGRVRDIRPGDKRVRLDLDAGGGETWRQVPHELATATCLDEPSVLELSCLATAVEAAFGAPVEVEWAVDELQRPWLLQARALHLAGQRLHPQLEAVAGCLEGLPASPGQAVGQARVVRGAAEPRPLGPEHVLVAKRLAPGALVGVSVLAGLVLEAGGTTSHAATLARERGIPAVFGVRAATDAIPEGAEVLVDGDAGRVRFRNPERRDRPETVPSRAGR